MGTIRMLWVGALLLTLGHFSTGEKILFLLPIASKSHANVFEPLTRALAERGHEVVNLSPVKLSKAPSNLRQIQILSVEQIFGEMANPFEMRKMGKVQALINGSFDSLTTACKKIMKTDTLHDLVTQEKFDLIVVDILMNYCVLGIVPLMKAPSIMVSTFAAPSFLANDVGNRLPSSFVADPFLDFTHEMNFLQRMGNVLMGSMMQLTTELIFLRRGEQIYKENLPNGKDLPGVHEIQRNTSMVFSNSHFAVTYPRPLLPDVIEVGGMHCRPSKPLPKDIDDFLSGSGEDGFIFFSLGSIVPAKVMPEEYRKAFLNVFLKLKQRVIWKWETESMPDLPPNSNVMLKKWLPQQDILGHPNIKLFLTHGGLLSTQEAVYHGVPLLGFPIFGDQDLNIKQAETSGYAKQFEILELTEEKLEKAIKELLFNPKYYEKAKELSKIVRDLPQTPLDKAVYWTEYVLRHKGAIHLRSASRELNFFQYYLLDVAAVLVLIIVLSLYLSYLILRALLRKLCGGRKSMPKKMKSH